MGRKKLKCISMALLVALLVSVLPTEFSYAALSEVNWPKKVTTFKSTETFDKEYLRCYVTDDEVLKVIYRTPLETSLFRLSLYKVGEDKGDINLNIFINPTVKAAADGTTTYNFTYYLNMEGYKVPDGKYNIYIRRCTTLEQATNLDYKSSAILNKNMEIQVTDGKVKILRYTDVLDYNRSIQAIGDLYSTDLYLDNSLEDIRFVLRNPATNVYATMTYDKISFIKSISDRVVSGAYTNYDKLLKIYEYTASNFYYDSVAFQTHSYQYADPYDNIRNFEYKLSSANSEYGKVATTCQGFSAIFLALARAQGIPTRFVYGHRLAVPSNDWITEDNIDVRDHWWVEAYVDGRWIFVDPTVGTTNKHNSNSSVWTYYGLTNYTYFDPSEEQIATSHVYMNIYPDYRYGKYIDNEYEITTLGAFLNATSGDAYKTNGSLMDSTYSFYNKETWGDGTKSHFMTDGSGNVSQIQWSYKGFTGDMKLPAFTTMTLLSAHHNELENVDLSGSTKLGKVFLQDNKLQTLDLSGCTSLWYVRAQNNPLKKLSLYVNDRNRTFEAGDNGTFGFTIDSRYNQVFSLYSAPDVGYKVEGVYNTATGSKITSAKSYHFKPLAQSYAIKFALDPDSYKYSIYPGDAQSYKVKYIQAAAKRLAALGYYDPNAGYSYYYGYQTAEAGTETSYTAELQAAAVKFQVMHDLPNTGNIGKQTWSALFNDSAVSMVTDTEYNQILADYQTRKAAEAQASAEMAAVKISAKSSAGKGYIKVTWTLTTADVSPTDLQGAPVTPAADGYEIWKSTKSSSGFKQLGTTKGTGFKNTSGLKKGTRYYYKVRAYKVVGEKKIYSDWSNSAVRIAK